MSSWTVRASLAFAAFSFLVGASLTGCGGCSKRAARGADGSSATGSESPDAPVANASDEIAPALPDDGPPDPRAARLCAALYRAPVEARARCCHEPSAPGNVEQECVRAASAALRGAARVDDGALAQCERERGATLEGCGWVGATPPAPASCSTVFSGTLGEGARCRTSMECDEGLRCHGASALDSGRCGRPRPVGASCGAAGDALSLAVEAPAIDAHHPECDGLCTFGRCKARAALGDACATQRDCGADNRCEAQRCVAGRVAVGAPCDGPVCAGGARCVAHRCVAPSDEGGRCSSDFDCRRGACVRSAPGDAFGVCGMRCAAWRSSDVHAR